ncbi:hypothetical protein WA026_014585 [Henosepilachna vigintioctopunctata]|uniref:RNA helicase n=1 Tax=Henosepilachna vigintioctopunctata TaxID=420089 RepID=A0AAW1VCH4_9CUCU
MDAYDIFKKLSKGVKFSKSNNRILSKKAGQTVKLEPLKVEVDSVSINGDISSQNPTEQNSTQNSSDNNITILSSSNIGNVNKAKKRKHGEESEMQCQRKKKLLEIEKINHYRNVEGISVVGKNVPEPAYTFDHFKIDADILENLKKCGYEDPTPIQKQAVPIMLEEQQILACAPTGSGKTAAFLVPIIQQLRGPQKQGFRSVILCPTRELAKQTQRECVRLSEGRNLRYIL